MINNISLPTNMISLGSWATSSAVSPEEVVEEAVLQISFDHRLQLKLIVLIVISTLLYPVSLLFGC